MLDSLSLIAEEAGRAISSVYRRDPETVHKVDGSPLTVADRLSHKIVTESLDRIAHGIPVLSEEGRSIDYETRRAWEGYFLVDPLDGTKGFLEQNDEFTVNVALIRGNRPVLGVVHHPPTGVTYAAESGSGAWRIEATHRTSLVPPAGATAPLRVLLSRTDKSTVLDEALTRLGHPESRRMHSSLKFCLLAEGIADLYLRIQPSMEWDTAAGDLILQEAGGRMMQWNGEPFVYNRRDLCNSSLIAFSRSFPEKVPDWQSLLKF